MSFWDDVEFDAYLTEYESDYGQGSSYKSRLGLYKEWHSLKDAWLIHETEKAFLVQIGDRQEWLPKSRCSQMTITYTYGLQQISGQYWTLKQ